jgi:hypothetical protein
MQDYEAYQPAVIVELACARSKLHFSFGGWTSDGNNYIIIISHAIAIII